jgi:hypothetical protein
VEAPKLTHLVPAERRPPTKQRDEMLVAHRPLLRQVVDGHRCKVVRELFHIPVIPSQSVEETHDRSGGIRVA